MSQEAPALYSIAVEAPMPEPLTYHSSTDLHRGQWVIVPLGSRKVRGLVAGKAVQKSNNKFAIKSIDGADPELPAVNEAFLQWLEWLADYYIHPLGMILSSARPPLSKSIKIRKSQRPPVIPIIDLQTRPQLTSEQKICFDDISSHKNFSTHLLFGITGSGKTEVYLRLIEKTLAENKKALVIVPEISLTPQLIQRFVGRFGELVAVLHSQLTEREKTTQWWEVIDDKKSILVGARSALFCPVENLGLIIVDEEHEPSYKQDEKLKYHARDASVMRGFFSQCPVVLGSATPSLESWKNAKTGKYHLHKMVQRATQSSLPWIQLVDMKEQKRQLAEAAIKLDIPDWLSPLLFEKMHEKLNQKQQIALFLNRRGMAQTVLCPSCGFTKECPSCDIHLTLHAHTHLVCHYCDYHESFALQCPSCSEGELKAIGLGTEKVEEELKKLFPLARIARADRDEINDRLSLEDFIDKMERCEIDILIGTQMIAKGLDFPNLKLVGILLADIGFNLPDFRATERSFQLLTQMSGRSGRHGLHSDPGEVIIQAYNLDHPSLQYALQHNYEGFAEQELFFRNQLLYPPEGKLASLRVQGKDQSLAKATARLWSERAQLLKKKNSSYANIQILGPTESALAKLRGFYRFHLLLKSVDSRTLNHFVRQLLSNQTWVDKQIKTSIDIDPLHLM
ncbi:MAG: replication restart helicase PriA [Pseudobdellovibrionaceae bacterium]